MDGIFSRFSRGELVLHEGEVFRVKEDRGGLRVDHLEHLERAGWNNYNVPRDEVLKLAEAEAPN